MIGVCTSLASYGAAIVELPQSARPSRELGGSIVVIEGHEGWFERAVSAVEAGAAGLVVADPAVEDCVLSGDADSRLRRVPVALDRDLLRADVAADAAREAGASVLTATCAAPSEAFGRTVCDAVGWLRILAGSSLRVNAVKGRGGGVILAAETGGGPAGLMARVLVEGAAVPRLRVSAIGEVRTDVSAASASATVLKTDDERGTVIAPARFESRERLALRRVIAAVTCGSPLTDLAEFASDAAIATAVRGALAP